METVSFASFRQNIREYIQKVNDNSEPLAVTSRDPEDSIVVMSKRDYDSMQETMTILSNAYLTNKIYRGDDQFAAGKDQGRELDVKFDKTKA